MTDQKSSTCIVSSCAWSLSASALKTLRIHGLLGPALHAKFFMTRGECFFAYIYEHAKCKLTFMHVQIG